MRNFCKVPAFKVASKFSLSYGKIIISWDVCSVSLNNNLMIVDKNRKGKSAQQ